MSERDERVDALGAAIRVGVQGYGNYVTALQAHDAARALLDSPAMRDLLAEAWDEGARKASPHGGGYLRSLLIENPYRQEAR